MTLEKLNSLYISNRESQLKGRYICNEHISPLFVKYSSKCQVEHIGYSVNKNTIESLTIGNGKKKILMWSQMHGNESTSTKAIFDMLNFMVQGDQQAKSLLNSCTIKVIPILNPDGANAYTRLNANAIDLNRDAQTLSQPESRVLRAVFETFKPDFCFNLHGQRTIFSAGKNRKPATLSFLAPAQDADCTITINRKIAMSIICNMVNVLQKEIPNQIGIYDDAFNLNCVGDTFQSFGVPTILFEAGHYDDDYEREEVRRLFFIALLEALNTIALNSTEKIVYESYFNIPMNEKLFYDIVFRSVIINENNQEGADIAIQFVEKLTNNEIQFVPSVVYIGDLRGYFGHKEIQGGSAELRTCENNEITVGYENDFVLFKNELFSLKP
ncbi:MAG: peptidase M14 [Flavobacteriaceae bacterium]|nr:peptidase M14 [Flavobacteriaceae bacterium]